MKFMVNSIPKGGTHLLLKLLFLLGITDDPKRFWLGAGIIRRGFEPLNKLIKGGYSSKKVVIGCEVPVEVGSHWLSKKLNKLPDQHAFGAHCLYTEGLANVLKQNNVIPVCIIRDPRAIAASHMHYIKKWNKHFFHDEYMKLKSDKERLRLSIEGGQLGKYYITPLCERYRGFLRWRSEPSAIVVKFENLVGVNGGGSSEAQREAILEVAKHISVEVPYEKMKQIQESLFGGKNSCTQSETFRIGKIDSWRVELDKELISLLETDLADVMNEEGYV